MAVRIPYTYTVYENYPEATAISEDRNKNKVLLGMLAITFLFLEVLLFLALAEDFWAELPTFILICGGLGLFLFYLYRYYDVVTEKKIKKAIQKRDQLLWEINHPTYDCKAIKIVMKRPAGKCHMCKSDNVDLFLCDIKHTKKSTSVIPVCNACIDRFKANIQ